MALYLTPDGEHVLIGSLLDAKGEDLTRGQLEKLVYEPLGKEMWARMAGSSWIADGRGDAPRIVYLFSDPNCPYCNMFWKQARPWVEAGKVQLRHIMVGMLRADSAGKSAALLSAKDPQAALNAHEAAGKASKLKALEQIPAALEKQLTDNLMLMSELGPGHAGDLLSRRQRPAAAASGRATPRGAGNHPGAALTPVPGLKPSQRFKRPRRGVPLRPAASCADAHPCVRVRRRPSSPGWWLPRPGSCECSLPARRSP